VSAPRHAVVVVDNASDHASTEIARATDGLPVSVVQCVGIRRAVPSRFASAEPLDGGRVGTAGARHPVPKGA
jgi:hypothetical protein